MPDEKPAPAKVDALQQITRWIIAGHTEADILEAMAEMFPRRKARPLIVAAMTKLSDIGKESDEDLIRGFALEGTRAIYAKALEVADHQTALRALKKLLEIASK